MAKRSRMGWRKTLPRKCWRLQGTTATSCSRRRLPGATWRRGWRPNSMWARSATSPGWRALTRSSVRFMRATQWLCSRVATRSKSSPRGPPAFDPAAAEGGSATVEKVDAVSDSGKSSFVGAEIAKNDRPELTAAKIIVSGGRAMGSSEKFDEVLTPLADKLGAALGASRAAVDAGYAPERLAGRPDRQDRGHRNSTSRAASAARSSTWPA